MASENRELMLVSYADDLGRIRNDMASVEAGACHPSRNERVADASAAVYGCCGIALVQAYDAQAERRQEAHSRSRHYVKERWDTSNTTSKTSRIAICV